MKSYVTYMDAVLLTLTDVMENGIPVAPRGMPTKELLMHSFKIQDSTSRVAVIKNRNGNIFAQVAETLWMLAGRNDLDWLELYIPQCKKWSDDGLTWRAAYGPRLRAYMDPGIYRMSILQPVDQIANVAEKLSVDPDTRQAVISIWDPARDWFVNSKDYPCNNWLHFIIRDGMLHLNVAVRSNDAMYGFSHADFFSWSTLLEMMAFWTGTVPGNITWNATSFHLYERSFDKALDIIRTPQYSVHGYTPHRVQFSTPFQYFDDALHVVFQCEEAARRGYYTEAMSAAAELSDELLMVWTEMMILYNAIKADNLTSDMCIIILNIIGAMPERLAIVEYLHRHDMLHYADLVEWTPREKEFMAVYGIA